MRVHSLPTAVHQAFPERLKELRISSGYTQKDIGLCLNMTRQGYGYYERGERRMTFPMMSVLAGLYQINIMELITLELYDFDIIFHPSPAEEGEEYVAGVPDGPEPLTRHETLLLNYYRSLPQDIRQDLNYFLAHTKKHRRSGSVR